MNRLVASISLASLLLASACKSTRSPDTEVQIGAPAPELRATAHDGRVIDLSARTAPTVVYFYPRDETPGCTAAACAFRDTWDRFEAAGVLVVGVSADSLESHRKFAESHNLPFPLVADEDLAWAHAFGVDTTLGMTHRVSFLIDAGGRIAKIYPKVDPGVHADELLDDIGALGR
jgi:thioredoxin-dependent peroxiredoxin